MNLPDNMLDALSRYAGERPQQVACRFLSTGEVDGPTDEWTYERLYTEVRAVAAALSESLPTGSRCLLLFSPGLDFVAGFLGCLWAGMVAVPAYLPDMEQSQPRALRRMLGVVRDCGATAVLTAPADAGLARMAADLDPAFAGLAWLHRTAEPAQHDAHIDDMPPAEQVAFLQYTSGSTGEAKGVMVSHENLAHNLRSQQAVWQQDAANVVSWLPVYHDMGLIGDILYPLFVGGTTTLMTVSAFIAQPTRWLRAISHLGGTLALAPNFGYELCVRNVPEVDLPRLDLSTWAVAVNGAEPIRRGTLGSGAEPPRLSRCGPLKGSRDNGTPPRGPGPTNDSGKASPAWPQSMSHPPHGTAYDLASLKPVPRYHCRFVGHWLLFGPHQQREAGGGHSTTRRSYADSAHQRIRRADTASPVRLRHIRAARRPVVADRKRGGPPGRRLRLPWSCDGKAHRVPHRSDLFSRSCRQGGTDNQVSAARKRRSARMTTAGHPADDPEELANGPWNTAKPAAKESTAATAAESRTRPSGLAAVYFAVLTVLGGPETVYPASHEQTPIAKGNERPMAHEFIDAQSTLLDREEEWQEIRRLLRSAAGGLGQSLIFQGGAGTGKTAILHEAAAQARSAGFRVMLARGSYLEHDVRLGLVRRLFDSVLPVLSGRDQQPFSRILQRLLREAGGRPEPGRTRRVLHLALRRLLWADENSPILVVVDNLHWADRESLEWLVTLPEHIASMPIALLASVCSGIPGTDPTLVDETLIESSRRVTLHDMTTNSVGALLADQFSSRPDPAFVAGVMRVTGGNPHLVTALTRKLVQEGGNPDPARAAALDTVVLDTLGQSVRVRLGRVSPHAHAVLRAVTALDEETTLHRLCAIVGLDLDETADIVARLRRLGLLTADRGRLRVAQLLVRNAVLDEDTYGALREIHAQAARLLRDEPGTEEAVCRHLILSAPIGEEWAAAALRSAARSALAAADPQRAVLLLQRSLSEPLSPDDRHQVLFALAAAAGNNDLPRAAAYLMEALSEQDSSHWPIRTLAGLIDVIALGGREKDLARLFAAERGRLATKADLLGVRLSILSDRDSAETNEVQRLQEQEPEEALTLAVTARRVADLGADRPRALALADRVLKTSPATPEELMARLQVCKVLMVAERTEEAVAQCEYGLDVARCWGNQLMIGFALTCQAACLRTAGDLNAADAAAQEAMQVLTACRASPDSTAVLGLRATQVEILLDLGQVQKAAALVDQSEPIPIKPRTQMGALLLGARGRLRRILGQPLSGLHDVVASGDYFTRHNVANPLVSPWRFEAALAAQELDSIPQARTYAQAELAGAHLWDTPGAVGRALRLVARVGYEPEARTTLERSVDVLYDSDQRLSLAESLTDLGTLLARQSEKTRAREVLRDACALAEETACAPLISRSRSELAAAGGRPKRPARNGNSGLTASERRVAELAAGDRTNKAIAAMLFVGQRTVEIHLTNAYRKLGIGGRDQLPAALRAAGLLATDHIELSLTSRGEA